MFLAIETNGYVDMNQKAQAKREEISKKNKLARAALSRIRSRTKKRTTKVDSGLQKIRARFVQGGSPGSSKKS